MSANSFGSYHSKRKHSMAAYDRLPPEVRKQIRNMAHDWAPQPIRTMLRKDCGPKEACKRLATWDREAIEEDTYVIYGPDHPQANNNGKRLKRCSQSIW